MPWGWQSVSVRILLLSAEFGSGHLAAAEAIAAACRQRAADCEIEVVQAKSSLLALSLRAYLLQLAHFPSLYRRLYHLPVGWPMRLLLVLGTGQSVRRAISRYQPDLIVGTHPFPAGVATILGKARGRRIPVVMALTDFLPHGFWVWPRAERYCVASEEAAAELMEFGVTPDRISITGVPIRPEFAGVDRLRRVQPEHPAVRQVLVMGGGLGMGPIEEAVRSLTSLTHPHLRITVVCGRNRTLAQRIQQLFGSDARVQVIGYTDRIIEYMTQSDLLVTKPGGITCSEALALSLPMLLLKPVPGHEEENADYLVQTGAALITSEEQVGPLAAQLLFEQAGRLQAMTAAAQRVGHARAAEAIANEVLTLVQEPPRSATVG